jgi:YVTN family beta-propeller protein
VTDSEGTPGDRPLVDDELGIDGFDAAVEIGRGGFGVVYRARQPALSRLVAIKVLAAPADSGGRERAEREGRAMGALSGHPNIVNVLETGLTRSGRPYIAMTYLAQGSLADRIRREGGLQWQEAVRIGVKLAGALESAHAVGTLHRDIKPENILLSDYGEPQLADFGIARVAGASETAVPRVAASIAHAAPEVLEGEPPAPRSDLYSLASTLFTLVAGRSPFARLEDEAVVSQYVRIARDPVPDLRRYGVPDAPARVLEQAMAKRPADRQLSAAELGRQLQETQRRAGLPVTEMALVLPATEVPPTAEASPVPPGARPVPAGDPTDADAPISAGIPRRRRWVPVAIASALAVAVVVGLIARNRGGPVTAKATVVAVGEHPTAVAGNHQTDRVYVANSGSRSISVVEGRTRRVVATVPMSSRPAGIAVNTKTNRIYVTNAEAVVSVIDGSSNRIVATVPMSSRPAGIAVNPKANRIYVTNTEPTVSVIDGTTNAVVATIPLGPQPWSVAVNPASNRVYVSHQGSGAVSVIDGERNVAEASITLDAPSCGLAVSPRTNRLYATHQDPGSVSVVDGDSLLTVKTIPLPTRPCGIAYSGQANRVYVSDQEAGKVSVLDAATDQAVSTRQVFEPSEADGVQLSDVTASPQSGDVYVVNRARGSLGVFPKPSL